MKRYSSFKYYTYIHITQFINVFIFLQGHEVAESSRQHVEPQNELAIGTKIKEYQQNPLDSQLRMDIGPIVHVPRAHGKVLDNDVKTGK